MIKISPIIERLTLTAKYALLKPIMVDAITPIGGQKLNLWRAIRCSIVDQKVILNQQTNSFRL